MALPVGVASTFSDLLKAAEDKNNVRKSLQLLLFLGKKSTVTIPAGTAIFDATGKITVPTGMWAAGIIDPKGIELEAKTDSEEIEGYNYVDPVRTDVLKVTRSLGCTLLEPDRKQVQELVRGVNLTGVVPDATSKSITFDEPGIPMNLDYVGLVVLYDINKATGSAYLDARLFTSLSLSEAGKESFTKQGAKTLEIKLSAAVDPTTGTSCRHVLGGPAVSELSASLGYAAA